MRSRYRRLTTVSAAVAALVLGSGTATAATAGDQLGAPDGTATCWGNSGLTFGGSWPWYEPVASGSTICDRPVDKITVRTWLTDQPGPGAVNDLSGYQRKVRYQSGTSGVTDIQPLLTCEASHFHTLQVYSNTIYVTKDSPKTVLWTKTGKLTCGDIT